MLKKMFGFGALVAIVAAVGCTATLNGGDTSDAGTDSGTLPTSTADASRPTPDGSTPTVSCYDEELALALEGSAPVANSGKCSDAQISGLATACLGASANGCDTFVDTNKDCARCVFGALTGDPASTPIGVLLSVSDEFVIVNTVSCAALTIGRADCAAKLAIQETCLSSACSLCEDEAGDTKCRTEAATGICKEVMDATCTQAIEARKADWTAACTGSDFDQEYAKVAKLFCGGSGDAGGGG